MRKLSILLFQVVFSIICVLIFFSSGVASAESFKVGVIIALSGPAAANGIAMRNSIELAQKDHPENFTNIKFVYEDASYDSAQAVRAFNKLKEIDKVNLFYVWGIAFCNPIAPLAEKAKLPVVCQGIEQVSYMNNRYLIRFMNSTDQYMRLLLSYIREQKWRNLGIVITDNPYVEGLLAALRRNALPEETFTVVDRYPTGQMDMSSTVTRLKHANFDAVGVFLVAGQIGQIYKLLAKQAFSTPTFGANFFENFDEIALGGPAMNGGIYVHNEVTPAFVDRYKNTFGNQSQLAFGGMAYEFAALVGELFNLDGLKLSADQILERFTEIESREGKAMGRFQFVKALNGDRFMDFPAAVKEVRNGSYRVVKR